MGLDDDDAVGKSSGCGLGHLFRRRGSNSLRSSSAPAATGDAVPSNPKAAAAPPHHEHQHQHPQSNHLHPQHRQHHQHRQSYRPNSNNGDASCPALVRASSGNVMLYGSLGNLRAPGAVTPNRNDVLDFLPMTADEIKLQTTQNSNAGIKPKPKPKQREAVLCRALSVREDPEELKKKGNDEYMAGNYVDAVDYYERAIAVDPSKPAYWSNKAAALMAMGRLLDAVADCREAIKVDPSFGRAHHRLGTLYLRTGHGDRAAKQYKLATHEASPEDMARAHAVHALVAKCDETRRRGSWQRLLKDAQAAVSAGADASPKLACYQAEALLSLQRPEEADTVLGKNGGGGGTEEERERHVEIFGAGSCAYLLATRALVDTAMGRLEAAVAAADEAVRVSPSSREAAGAARQAQAVASARDKGNALFKAGKLREACAAYEEGLREHPGNSTLLCNRAACRCKLGEWEAALRDCDAALGVRPSYSKARLRRAACNDRLGRWEASVLDYEALLHEAPGEEEVARALAHARTQLISITHRHAAV